MSDRSVNFFTKPDELPITNLPETPTQMTFTQDVAFYDDDLSRFFKLGGTINAIGYRLWIVPRQGSAVHMNLNTLEQTHRSVSGKRKTK